MTLGEFTRIREENGLRLVDVARLVGVDIRTVIRWTQGDAGVPGPVAFVMRGLDEDEGVRSYVMRRHAWVNRGGKRMSQRDIVRVRYGR